MKILLILFYLNIKVSDHYAAINIDEASAAASGSGHINGTNFNNNSKENEIILYKGYAITPLNSNRESILNTLNSFKKPLPDATIMEMLKEKFGKEIKIISNQEKCESSEEINEKDQTVTYSAGGYNKYNGIIFCTQMSFYKIPSEKVFRIYSLKFMDPNTVITVILDERGMVCMIEIDEEKFQVLINV